MLPVLTRESPEAMTESQTRTEQRASAVKPQGTPAVVGEPGITDRKAPGDTPWENDHPVNIRLTIPLFKWLCYVTLVAGKERRSAQRMAEERQKHPLGKTGNVLIITVFGILTGLACLAVIQMTTGYILQQSGVLVGAQ